MSEAVASRDLRAPTDYLRGDDVYGREVVLTIAEALWDPNVPDPKTGKPTKKPVLVCQPRKEGSRPIRIVLDKARRMQLIALFGEDFKNDWPGKQVTVYCDGQRDGKGEPKKAPNGSRMVAFKAAK